MEAQAPTQEMEFFHFLALVFALAFAFHTCEPGQREGKRTQDEKYSFHAFKPGWRPPG